MHVDSPVQVHAERPARYERTELVLRLVILMAIALVGVKIWPFGLLYLSLPIVAAVMRSRHDPARFVDEDQPRLSRFVVWTAGVLAYFALVTDRLPGTRQPTLDVRIAGGAAPTVGSALARLVFGLPSALVLAILGCVASVTALIAAVAILFTRRCPRAIWGLQLAVVRWHARLFAYQAGIVDAYPPFTLDTEGTRPVDAGGPIPI